MAGSLNKVILIGHLGADPEVKSLGNDARVANFTIATSESWTDKSSGDKKERTQWHKIVCFNNGLVSVIERFCKKGSKIYIEGQIENRKWTDKDGKDHYITEVVLRPYNGELILLSGNNGGSAPDHRQQQYEQGKGYNAPSNQTHDGMADDIPF